MSEIPRWTPKYLTSWEESGAMRPAVHGGYVDYSDHVAAMQSVKSEYSEVRDLVDSAGPHFYRYPQPKFKIWDRVRLDEQPEILVITGIMGSQSVASDWSYDLCTTAGVLVTRVSASRIDLYVPPTPAELIPTLVEHEWVRGTTVTGESFEGYVIFNNGNTFGGVRILGFDYSTSPGYIKTIERCDAPEVK